MRDLDQLRSDPTGRRFLEEALTFDDPALFLTSLTSPAAADGLSTEHRVYAHQQVYLDYRASVVAKFQTLRTLSDLSPDLRTDFLWIDTDRSGSDKLSLRLYLDGRHGAIPVRLAPSGCESREPRFVATDPLRLCQGVDHMESIIGSIPPASAAALMRLRRLRPLIEAGGTLADLNRRVSDFLLQEVLAFRPHPVLVSELTASGTLTPALNAILNQLPEFVATFNERIGMLRSADIDPKVSPLPEDYLPFFVAAPGDRRRLRPRLVRDGGMHLACVIDGMGGTHCYPLGREELSVDQLVGQVDYSPDVTLPILVNEHYSGMVCGKSSALYLLVFADVMRKVLGMAPIPVLVPAHWDVFPGAFDSLVAAYLDGRTV